MSASGAHGVARFSLWAAAGCGLMSAAILGLLNGLLVTTTKINSFIATLSTMVVHRGIAMVLSQGQPISSFQVEPEFFDIMGRGKGFGTIPVPIFWMAGWE
jgi:ribose transport system permease protein